MCYALGRERLRAGDYSKAEELLRVAWNGDRSLVSAAASLARCVGIELGQLDQAHDVLDQVDHHHGALALTSVVRGELHLENHEFAAAERCANTALELAGDNDDTVRHPARAILARVVTQTGIELGQQHRCDEALFMFRRAASLDPDWSGPRVNMGVVFAAIGNMTRAREELTTALHIDPHNALAYTHLGLIEKAKGRFEDARDALEAAIDIEPESVDTAIALAETYLELNEPLCAVAVLKSAAAYHPDHAGIWCALGIALCRSADVGGGEHAFRRALAADDAHVPSLCRLASLLTREGRYIEATALAKRAMAVDPNGAHSALTDVGGVRPPSV